MPGYGNNMYGNPQPTNNLWVGNNYSNGFSQMSRSNYSNPMGAMNTMNNPINTPQPMNNVLQVMGPESAQAFQLGPDSQVILMDSNQPVFYTKKSDSAGYSETKAFKYHEIPLFPASPTVVEEAPKEKENYVTKQDFEEFKKVIEELVMNNE